jgi:hypothetical protein
LTEPTPTVSTLQAILDAFNQHDVDAITAFSTDDAGIKHFAEGNRGASEWSLAGTTIDGTRPELRGCDLWAFCDGLVTRKGSFWKIVEPMDR